MKTPLAAFYLVLAIVSGLFFGPIMGATALFCLAQAYVIQVRPDFYNLGVALDITSPNTGTSLATLDENSVRQLWQDGIDVFDQNADFFSDYIGGPNSTIWEKTDLAKGRGQKITFTVASGFYDEPHIGESLFTTPEDYEEFLLGSHELFVDWARHGTKISERAEEVMGLRGEILSGFNTAQGDWAGRYKSEQLFMMFREQLPRENVLYPGSNTLDTLVSADTLKWDDIVALGTVMGTKNGQPAQMRTENGHMIQRNNVVATKDALFSLKLDDTYKELIGKTTNAEAAKVPFKGGYVDVDNHIIREYAAIDHDGEGAIGSPLNPKAKLGVAIAAGTTALTVYGGGNATSAAKAKKLFFKYFPNFAYKFLGSTDPKAGGVTLLAQDALTHYFLIVNPPWATDGQGGANKIGMYAYTTGNNGNAIAVTKRLGPTTAGIGYETVGSVQWNTGVWADRHTEVHPEDALILPCNAKGQVFGDTLMLGKRCAYRGYGKFRNTRREDGKEGGMLAERYIVTVFGQALRKDRLSRVPAVMRLRHAITYAGLPLPEIE